MNETEPTARRSAAIGAVLVGYSRTRRATTEA
jgi:hypothetical protein